MGKTYKTTVFKTLDIGQWRQRSLRQEPNEMIPMISPAYYLKRVSRPQHRELPGAQVKHSDLPEWGDWTESPGRLW